MEKVAMQKPGSEVVRRTAPLKVTIGLLYRELESAKAADAVTVNRELLESIVTTLECVVEDVESKAGRTEVRPVGTEGARVAVARS